jgi:integrase
MPWLYRADSATISRVTTPPPAGSDALGNIELARRGVPLPEVRDLLGHCTVTMTEKYAHLAPDNVRAAVAVLDGSVSHFCHSEDRPGVPDAV